MADTITKFKGKRQPPLESTIQTDSSADALPAGATVTFSMRAVGSSTLKVSAAAATVVSEPLNQVRYDWAAADVDTAADYLGWFTVTISGQTEDTPEFLIRILDHVPDVAYLELEEAKTTLELDATMLDADLRRTLVAASRAIDEMTGTRFYTTTSTEIRYYTPTSPYVLMVDDANTITEVASDDAGGTVFGTVWTANTDYVAEPLNAVVDGEPVKQIRKHPRSTKQFRCYPRSVRVTGKFGWPAVPEAVKVATSIVSTQFLTQARSAPLGIITGFDGTAVRISSFGPRVQDLLAPYVRRAMIE